MYEFMKGTLIDKLPSKAIVEVGGIGYRLAITVSTFNQLPAINHPVQLYLSYIVREESQTLYAFLSEEERNMFEQLLTISGIGPKTALAIIGHIDGESLQKAIATSDIHLLSKIPGIGKKTAERLVLEMRDKFELNVKNKGKQIYQSTESSLFSDALRAMIRLGYSPQDAQKAVQAAWVEEKEDLGRLITSALQKI